MTPEVRARHVSAGGLVPASACSAAAAATRVARGARSACSAAARPQRRLAHVRQPDPGRCRSCRCRLDDRRDAHHRPVERAPAELEVRPAGGAHLRAHAPRRSARPARVPSRRSRGRTPPRRSSALAAGPAHDDLRVQRQQRPSAGRSPGRRGRSSRRSCRGGAPAVADVARRRRPAAGSAPRRARRVSTSWWRVSAPMAMWSPPSRMSGQVGHAADVDEHRRLGEPQLHQRQQAVPAGEELGVVPCSPSSSIASSTRLGDLVVERCGDHDRASCASWIARHTRSGVAGRHDVRARRGRRGRRRRR